MKSLFTIIFSFFAAFLQGQVVLEVDCTVPYDAIYPKPPYYSDHSGGGAYEGSLSARSFFLTHEAQDASTVDTLFFTGLCKDLFFLPRFRFGYTPPFKVFHGYHDFMPLDSIYSLPTSRLWRRRNYGQQFCYTDCEMTMVVKDLGLHDAHLINRTARRCKDMFVDRQVRVLLVEEIVAMRYFPQADPSLKQR